MTTFSDGFDRANGAIGNNWTVLEGALTISSGHIQAHYGAMGVHPSASAPDAHDATISSHDASNQIPNSTPVIKCSDDGAHYYCANLTWAAPGYTWHLYRIDQGTPTELDSHTENVAYFNDQTTRLTWADGVLNMYRDGNLLLTANDNNLAANTNQGFRMQSNLATADNFTCEAGISQSIEVTPDPLWVGGGQTKMTATGTGTTWTPGQPGSSLISADYGTVDMQNTLDATHIEFFYTPAEWLGSITFTEDQYGAQDTINGVVIRPEGYPGGVGQLSQNAVEYIEYSANQGGWGILNQGLTLPEGSVPETALDTIAWIHRKFADLIDPDGAPPEGWVYIDVIWDILTHKAAPGNDASFREVLNQILTNTGTLETPWLNNGGPDHWTIDEVLMLVQGVDSRSLTSVYNLIENMPGTDLGPVLDAISALSSQAAEDTVSILQNINAVRGADLVNLTQLYDLVIAMRGTDGPSIRDVLDRLGYGGTDHTLRLTEILQRLVETEYYALNAKEDIDAIHTPNHYTLQSILDAISTGNGGNLSSILTAISNLRGDDAATVKDVLAHLTALRTGNNYTIQTVLDRFSTLGSGNNWDLPALLLLALLALAGNAAGVASTVVKVAGGKLDLIVDIIDGIIQVADFFLDLWNTLKGQSGGLATNVAPAYPGPLGVDLLAPVNFDTQIVIATPLHGALIDISTPGKAPWAIAFSEPTRYGRLGVFSFSADDSRYEPIQPIQWVNQIATPKGIVSPTGMVVQCKPGTLGTVTPYTLKE